jgi:hypothetical protein
LDAKKRSQVPIQKRNVFLFRINLLTLKNLCRDSVSNFTGGYGLNNTISQQNWNSIDDGITPPAALTAYDRSLKFQGLVADGANNPAQILCL